MKITRKLVLLVGASMLVLPACQQKPAQNDVHAQATAPVPPAAPPLDGHAHVNDAGVIPSQSAAKTRTTNEYGGTTYGLGSSVYSLIGSSGLHSDGLSSHLESRLSGVGISDVKVLAIDDIIVLAAEKRQPTGSKYDAMQQKVLSNTGGQSARGPEPGRGIATTGSGAEDDNLDMAENQIRQFLGTNVKVYKMTGAQAVETINRIRTNGGQATVSPKAMGDDIGTLLNLIGHANK